MTRTIWSIEKLNELVKDKGKCLEKEYKNPIIKINWECNKGHQWKASSLSITRGTWCPHCSLEEKNKKYYNKIKKLIESKVAKL